MRRDEREGSSRFSRMSEFCVGFGVWGPVGDSVPNILPRID